MAKPEVKINIVGDAAKLKKALGEAETATSNFSTNAKKLAGAVVATAAVTEGFQFLKDAAQDAAEDEAAEKIYRQQLKNAGASDDVVAAFNKQISAGMRLAGFTDDELRPAYAQAFAQSKDMAQAQKDVALAMDIARAKGVPLEQALDAVTKAHNGNTKAIKSMLPEQAALIDGAASTEDALKAVADATRGSADAWASTTEGQMTRAQIAFGELKEQIGTALLPVLTKLAEWLTTTVIPAFQRMADWVKVHWPEIRDTITDAVSKIWGYVEPVIETMQALWRQFGDNILAWIGPKLEAVKNIFQGVFDAIMGIFRLFQDLFTGKWSELGDDLGQIVGGIKQAVLGVFGSLWADLRLGVGIAWEAIKGLVSNALDSIVSTIGGLPGRIATAAVGMFDGIKEAFRGALNWIIDKWNGLEFRMPSVDTHIPGVGTIGGWALGTPNIPRFHSGGMVPGSGEVPALLLGGERVLNRQEARNYNGGGSTYNVTVNGANMTPDELVAAIKRYEKRNGLGWRSI